MNILRKCISAFIACLIILGFVPAASAADDSLTYGDFQYTVSDGAAAITKYTGTDANVTIPCEIDGMPVKSIEIRAFYNRYKLCSVEIPDGITEIGQRAFEWCSSLLTVEIPPSVKSIGQLAFEGCYSLSAVTFNEGLETIGADAFKDCWDLDNVELPNSLKSLSTGLFEGCKSLTKVKLPEGIEVIPVDLFKNCTSLSEFDIPDTVVEIYNYAFMNTGFESVSVPENVITLGTGVYSECSKLKSAELPNRMKRLPDELFDSCRALESISFSCGLTALGAAAFKSCNSLRAIDLPDTLNTIGEKCFQYCSALESISIPYGITSVPAYGFNGCKALKSVSLPSSVTTIESYAFSACSALESIALPKKLSEIKMQAFRDCSALKAIDFPDSLASCSESAFQNCTSLTDVRFSAKLSVIPKSMFSGCSSLKSIELPYNITKIEDNAFSRCSALEKVVFPNKTTSIGNHSVGFNYLGYYNGSEKYEINPNTTIFGYYQSTAESYANKYGVKYVEMSTNPEGVHTTITLDKETIKVMKYRTRQIGYKIENPGGRTKFESTDSKIVKVNSSGEIEAVSVGTAYVAITNADATVAVKIVVTEYDVDIKHEQKSKNYRYYFVEDENEKIYVRITQYTGSAEKVVIPSAIKGYPVKEIGEEAFTGERYTDDDTGEEYNGELGITSVEIPEGVETLRWGIFSGCNQLEYVKFPSTIKHVEGSLFYDSMLKSSSSIDTIEFPSIQAFIDYAATAAVTATASSSAPDKNRFVLPNMYPYNLVINGKKLKTATIPEGTANIPDYLFYNCKSIEKVIQPEGLVKIGEYAFFNCENLKSVNFPESITNIEQYAFYNCCSVTKVVLPEYLKKLGALALSGTSITTVTFPPDALVNSYVCENCYSLETVYFNCKKLPSYCYGLFTNCDRFREFHLGYNAADLKENMFSGLTRVPKFYIYTNNGIYSICRNKGWNYEVLPQPLNDPYSADSDFSPIPLYPNFFYDAETGVYTVTDKDGAHSGENAYPSDEAWNAKTVVFDFDENVSLTSWCTQWFYNVENVIIKGNVRDVEYSAFIFAKNTLKSVELSDNVSVINNSAFADCEKLTEVKGGNGLKTIGYQAFLNCTALRDISFASSAEFIGNSAFAGCTGLSDFVIPDSVKTVSHYAFADCPGVNRVEIPPSVTTIGRYALGYLYNNEQEEYYPIPDFTVLAAKGSLGEKYALDNGLKIVYTGSVEPEPVPKLSASKLTLASGKVKTLKVADGKVKSWKSSDSKTVSVSGGRLTALKKGAATVTATLTTGKKLTCKVTVTSSPKLSKQTVSVKKGKTASVKLTGKASAVNNVYTNTKTAKITSKVSATALVVKGLRKGTTTLKIKVNKVVALKLKVKVK